MCDITEGWTHSVISIDYYSFIIITPSQFFLYNACVEAVFFFLGWLARLKWTHWRWRFQKRVHKTKNTPSHNFERTFVTAPNNKCDVLNRLRKECQGKCLTQAHIQFLGTKNINENKNVTIPIKNIQKTPNIFWQAMSPNSCQFGTFFLSFPPHFLDLKWTNKISA